ncbi:MAG TPA: hypothetical protein VKH40_03510, partial [Alloacidobacterium sp.]|nr:hypothetical protein [Alloacidobacterium sp.]
SDEIGNAFWMVFVLILVAVYDLDENTLLPFNGLFWILYVGAIANIEIMAFEQKSQRRNHRMSEVERVPAHAVA